MSSKSKIDMYNPTAPMSSKSKIELLLRFQFQLARRGAP
jgi:hypothetical protein